MLITIPDVLTLAQVTQARQLLASAEWIDGRVTAGHQSAQAKNNQQIPENSPVAQQLGESILQALGQNALFISAALPMKGLSAAVQQLQPGPQLRHPCRQCHPPR